MSEDYVIRHGGAFYRPKAQGYTYNVAEAGRWPKEEAEKHINHDPQHIVTVHPVSEFEEPEYQRSFRRTFGLDQMTPEEFEEYLASK